MQRLENCFADLRASGRKGLITFITAGDPDLDATPELIACLEANGADIIELGVPFSDPLADGPTIQAASARALAAGASLAGILKMVAEVRSGIKVPLVLMSYYNPLYAYGLRKLVDDAVSAGVDGIIVPDLPLEEAAELRSLAAERLAVIPLAAPTTGSQRLRQIVEVGTGFLYYVTVTGITGARRSLPERLAADLDRVKDAAGSLPLAAGFGIATPEQAISVGRHADAVIVGSALVEIIARLGKSNAAREELGARVRDLKSALEKI